VLQRRQVHGRGTGCARLLLQPLLLLLQVLHVHVFPAQFQQQLALAEAAVVLLLRWQGRAGV
jgi:hypothetical protein